METAFANASEFHHMFPKNRIASTTTAAAAFLVGLRSLTRFESPFPTRGAKNGNNGADQNRHERKKKHAQGLLHGECVPRGRRDWYGELAGALRTVHLHADLPRAGLHQPDFSGEKLRIVFRLQERVGRRWVF
jgi:hypothetical protein